VKRHDYGDLIELSATFRDADGNLADPTTVTLKLIMPTGGTITVNTGGLTHPSTGIYRYNQSGTVEGTWTRRWESTGTPQEADEGQFGVRATPFY